MCGEKGTEVVQTCGWKHCSYSIVCHRSLLLFVAFLGRCWILLYARIAFHQMASLHLRDVHVQM